MNARERDKADAEKWRWLVDTLLSSHKLVDTLEVDSTKRFRIVKKQDADDISGTIIFESYRK
jgi:hypothetical protein